ncbi:MAG: thiamine-phosphate kinase [Erythrobacter sp.]|nr:thiamine-phosphate kinase [Erythrobacter sp.]
MNEREFISALRALATTPEARGLEDDAAVIEIGGETLVLTHDTLVDGVHVLEGQDPADIAWKLVAVNLSDLAAKGAEPVGILVSHMLGDDDHRFIAGLREICETYDVPLLGGDTVRAEGRRVWGCTAIGRATHRPVPSRSGAVPDDAVYLGGPIGKAMTGFESLRDDGEEDDTTYRRPTPQLELGEKLAPLVSAMMDVSDGLLLDASRIADASKATLSLSREALEPLAPQGRLDEALRWGDDYVLLCTGPAGLEAELPLTPIGEVLKRGPSALLLDGEPPHGDLGFTH